MNFTIELSFLRNYSNFLMVYNSLLVFHFFSKGKRLAQCLEDLLSVVRQRLYFSPSLEYLYATKVAQQSITRSVSPFDILISTFWLDNWVITELINLSLDCLQWPIKYH